MGKREAIELSGTLLDEQSRLHAERVLHGLWRTCGNCHRAGRRGSAGAHGRRPVGLVLSRERGDACPDRDETGSRPAGELAGRGARSRSARGDRAAAPGKGTGTLTAGRAPSRSHGIRSNGLDRRLGWSPSHRRFAQRPTQISRMRSQSRSRRANHANANTSSTSPKRAPPGNRGTGREAITSNLPAVPRTASAIAMPAQLARATPCPE